VKTLAAGKEEFERITEREFQFVGTIRLSAACLKCHARNRMNNDERKAGLVVTIPLTK
jgi:hypothetical protein